MVECTSECGEMCLNTGVCYLGTDSIPVVDGGKARHNTPYVVVAYWVSVGIVGGYEI